ncbi:hypothetical protein HN51_064582 [Arachis hypogaea]
MYEFSRREEPWWSFPDRPDPMIWFQIPVRTGEVRHANVPWMIHISGSGTDERIGLSMWLRALTVQAQRCNYQGRALPLS